MHFHVLSVCRRTLRSSNLELFGSKSSPSALLCVALYKKDGWRVAVLLVASESERFIRATAVARVRKSPDKIGGPLKIYLMFEPLRRGSMAHDFP